MRSTGAPAPKRLFYGWVVVAAAFVGQALHSGLALQGFGTFVVPIQEQFGWSNATLGGARAAMQIETSLTGPVEGALIDRFGPRVMMSIGMFILGLGMILLALIESLWSFYLAFIVIALGTSVGGFLVMSTAVNLWFRRRRTMALSVAQMGLGFGGVALIPLLVWVQSEFGWRTAAISAGVAVWAIGIPIAQLMRHAPERYGLLPDGDPPGRIEAETKAGERPRGGGHIDFTLKEALKTRAFWQIGLAHGLAVMGISAASTWQFAHMEEGVGLSRGSAALVVTVLSASNMAGRLVGGVLGDRFDKRYLAAVGNAGSSASLVILALASSILEAMAFGVMFGFFWGMRGPMMSSIRGDFFGRAAFGKIAGTSFLITVPGSMLGPVIAGFMADAYGGFESAFITLACVSALGILLFILTRPPAPPARLRATTPT